MNGYEFTWYVILLATCVINGTRIKRFCVAILEAISTPSGNKSNYRDE